MRVVLPHTVVPRDPNCRNAVLVIEGGVQRVANRVRVTARLVDARRGEQKWADSYDRELADVFSIQSQIAQTIVAQLQAKLLPREKAAIEVPPTRDPVAYDLFLRARDIVDSYPDAQDQKASLEQAIGLLEEATDATRILPWRLPAPHVRTASSLALV